MSTERLDPLSHDTFQTTQTTIQTLFSFLHWTELKVIWLCTLYWEISTWSRDQIARCLWIITYILFKFYEIDPSNWQFSYVSYISLYDTCSYPVPLNRTPTMWTPCVMCNQPTWLLYCHVRSAKLIVHNVIPNWLRCILCNSLYVEPNMIYLADAKWKQWLYDGHTQPQWT